MTDLIVGRLGWLAELGEALALRRDDLSAAQGEYIGRHTLSPAELIKSAT